MAHAGWTILIIGDLFVTHELFRNALESHLAGIQDVRYKIIETFWPDDPLKDVEEVHEGVETWMPCSVRQEMPTSSLRTMGPSQRRMIVNAPKLKLIAVARGGQLVSTSRRPRSRESRSRTSRVAIHVQLPNSPWA